MVFSPGSTVAPRPLHSRGASSTSTQTHTCPGDVPSSSSSILVQGAEGATPGRTQAGATGARAQRCPGWGRAAIGRGGCWWGRVSAGLSAQLSRGRDSPSPARTHQSSRQPLIRQTGLGGGWRARAPPSPSKLCRGKKNNARNYSGWQINKLALITIRVSQPPLPRAHQPGLLSRSAPAALIPAPAAGAPCSFPWGSTPGAAGGNLTGPPCSSWGLRGPPRGREVPFQEPKWCNGRALPRFPGSGL